MVGKPGRHGHGAQRASGPLLRRRTAPGTRSCKNLSDPAQGAEHGPRAEQPQQVDARAPDEQHARCRDDPQPPALCDAAVRAAEHEGGGQQQAQHDRRHALLEGAHGPHVAVAVRPARGGPGEQAAGQHDTHEAEHHPEQAQGPAARVEPHVPAQQPDEQHVRAGRGLGDGDGGVELRIGQPGVPVHEEAVHVRGGGDGAAHGQQGQREVVREQVQPVGRLQCQGGGGRHAGSFRQVSAQAEPPIASSTAASGHCSTAMATNVSAASAAPPAAPSGCVRSATAMRRATPATRPAATAPMPRRAPATAGWAENRAYATARHSSTSRGSSSMPARADSAPRQPK